MTHHHRHLTRALMIAALAAGAWTAHELADDSAAHAGAGDKNPAAVAEQPGGVLGHLPEQAADRAREVVDQAVTDKASDEPAPTPAETPAEPAPADEPEPPADEPAADPIVEAPPAEVPPVVEVPPIVETEPVVVEPIPTTDPIVITLPATGAAPLPDADDLPLPLRQPTPVVDIPGSLPVLIAPVPAAQPAAAPAVLTRHAAAVDDLDVALCADDTLPDPWHGRGIARALRDRATPPADSPRVKPAPGCPGNPLDPRADCASTGATSSGQTNTGHIHADLAGSLTAPALARLTHARARSSIPAGRHTAIEPGPA